jgi:hypothetical protein
MGAIVGLALVSIACAASTPVPEAPSDEPTYDATAYAPKRRARPRPTATAEAEAPVSAPASEIVVKPGSYEDALARATSGADDEILGPTECGKPFTPMLVIDCGVQGSVSVKLAIQNGRPIGVTAASEPRQPRVEECVLSRARRLAWRSVPGLSTCTRSFRID